MWQVVAHKHNFEIHNIVISSQSVFNGVKMVNRSRSSYRMLVQVPTARWELWPGGLWQTLRYYCQERRGVSSLCRHAATTCLRRWDRHVNRGRHSSGHTLELRFHVSGWKIFDGKTRTWRLANASLTVMNQCLNGSLNDFSLVRYLF